MAVKKIKDIVRYCCLSTDIKPIPDYSHRVSAELMEYNEATDTTVWYDYGPGGWQERTIGNINIAAPSVATSTLISPTGGSKTVAAGGTAETLVASETKCNMLYVRAKSTNTGNIYFGDLTVDKTSNKQVVLSANQFVTIEAPSGYCLDVNEFYIDADINAEGVDFLYV